MARLITSGAELKAISSSEQNIAPDGQGSIAGNITIETTIIRSGLAAWKFQPSGAGVFPSVVFGFVGTLGQTYYARAYVRFPSFSAMGVGNGTSFMHLQDAGGNRLFVTVDSSGVIKLFNSGTPTQIGSNGPTLEVDRWYRIEISLKTDTGSIDTAEALVDGVSFASGVGLSIGDGAVSVLTIGFGGATTSPGTSGIVYIDDVAVNDDQGTAQNSWCGAGKVLLVSAGDDLQRGSWTGGVGGTTNLFQALHNTPPQGTAAETDSTQIESVDSSGDNATDEYRAHFQGIGGTVETWDTMSKEDYSPVSTTNGTTSVGTLTGNVVAAQQFINGGLIERSVEFWLNIGKVGTPTDFLALDLYSDNGSDSPGQLIDRLNVIEPNAIGGVFGAFCQKVFFPPATKFWLVLSRTGSLSDTNYYTIAHNDLSGYAGINKEGTSLGSLGTDTGKRWQFKVTDYIIPNCDQMAILIPLVCTGEDVATNTKTGSFGMIFNPVSGAYSTFTFGNDIGALGTYPTNWRWTIGTSIYNPVIAFGSGTQPQIALRKTDTGTRVASVCFLGAYVEWDYYIPRPDPIIQSQKMSRRWAW